MSGGFYFLPLSNEDSKVKEILNLFSYKCFFIKYGFENLDIL